MNKPASTLRPGFIPLDELYLLCGRPWTWKRLCWRLAHWGERPWELYR